MSASPHEWDALLIGYLLRSLDPGEEAAVEAALEGDPELRERLGQLAARLHELGLDRRPPLIEPPAGLAERTCQQITGYDAAGWRRRVAAACAASPERTFRWSDVVALAAVLLAAVSLVLPALAFSRYQARVALCQNQLRLIGLGLQSYSEAAPDHCFPGPEATGNRAAAGIVAPLLVSHQLAYPVVFLCPASPVQRRGFTVPSLAEVDRATGARLRALQREMGGDYGYNLGYVEAGQLLRPRNLRRSHYIVVADAPSNLQPRRVSANHHPRGQNVLYEDGHVQFLCLALVDGAIDDPFHNREGWIAAGVDQEDTVLGVSWDPPLPVPPAP
jgi:hypothetical protein